MQTTYRAAYFVWPNGRGDTVLTTPEMADQSDDHLRTEAMAEAMRAGLIGNDAEAGQVTQEQFLDGLHVGQWTD